MKFGTITRGSQKIYILLTAHCPEGGLVAAESKTKTGEIVPVLVSEKDVTRGEYILILPLLHTEQVVTVRVSDAAGNTLEEAKQKVSHFASAIAAKYNTFRNVPEVNEIRNFDRLPRRDTARIELRSICSIGYDADNSELVRITVIAPCNNPECRASNVAIKVFDQTGRKIEIKNVVTLGDKVDKPVQHSSFQRRVIDISFRKDRGNAWLAIYAEFENGLCPPALICIGSEDIINSRNNFEDKAGDTSLGPNYESWYYFAQKISPMELEAQRKVQFEIEPMFSFVVPLYQTPITFFHEMICSVLNQTYSNFEVILVNASPENSELSAAIHQYMSIDNRIRLIELEGNLGIALNTNEGIKAAKGDFICFFDHDDVLELNILFEYVDAINRYPETDMLYCDEDRLLDGHYMSGLFKPDFSWDLLTSLNYICHLLTVRKALVDEIELSDNDVTGAQDWDMSLKIAERARNIFHVRKVLYHWRIHERSVTWGADVKPYTHLAGEKAILNHFARIGINARVKDGKIENTHHVEYCLPNERPKVSIIIPNKDQSVMLKNLIESISDKTDYENYEVVIVENNSVEKETFKLYDDLQVHNDKIKLLVYDGIFNYSAICNYGAKYSSGEYLLFLNNDMEVITKGWLELMLGSLMREDVGAIGARLLYPDETIQHSGVILNALGPAHVMYMMPQDIDYYGIVCSARDVSAVTGACLMTSREIFDAINGFDEEFVVEYNDIDFCLRIREQGYRVVVDPGVELYHFESVSRGGNTSREQKAQHEKELALFRERWMPVYAEGDPWYCTYVNPYSSYYALDWTFYA